MDLPDGMPNHRFPLFRRDLSGIRQVDLMVQSRLDHVVFIQKRRWDRLRTAFQQGFRHIFRWIPILGKTFAGSASTPKGGSKPAAKSMYREVQIFSAEAAPPHKRKPGRSAGWRRGWGSGCGQAEGAKIKRRKPRKTWAFGVVWRARRNSNPRPSA